MKYLLSILFICFSLIGFSQRTNTPGTVGRSNAVTNVEDFNLFARNVLGSPRYDDTTQANTYTTLDTLGRIIFTYNTMSLWVRSNVGGGNRWVEVGSGGGGGGSGLFPTSGTGTATGSVIGDLDGNLFQIESGGEQVFKIDIANNFSQFKARDGAGSNAKIDLFADNGNDVRIHLRADYSVINGESELTLDALNGGTFNLATNDGSISVNILGEATVNTITYTATTHIFDGGNRLLALAGNGSGVVAVDNDGDLSWTAGGGSGLFPTSGTGTATGDVTGDLDGFNLYVTGGLVGIAMAAPVETGRVFTVQNGIDNVDLLHVDVTPNSEHSIIKSINTFNEEINYAFFESQTTENYANFELESNYGGGVKVSNIVGHTDPSESYISYSSDNHQFSGGVRLSALSGSGNGLVAVDDDGDLSWTGMPNILVKTAGTGTITWFNDDDTLNLKSIVGETFISVGTKTDSTIYVRLDTASSGLKNYISMYGGGGGSIGDGDKGDITVSGTGTVWTINNNAVTFAKMQAITDGRLLGSQGGTAVEEISVSSPLTLTSNALGIQNAAADGSTKGAASFTANDFDATTGNISIDYTNGQAASNSVNGFVNTTTQTFAGVKTFNAIVTGTAGFVSSATAANANFYVGGGQTATTNNTSANLFAGAAAIAARVIERGSTTYTILANSSYTHHVIGAQLVNTAASGTHAGLAGLVVHPPVVSSAGGATVTDMATLWIPAVPSGVSSTNPAMAIRADAGGLQLVNGSITLGTAGNKINIATGSNASVGTSTLVGGTVTVSTTAVTASSKIFLTVGVAGGTQGILSVGTVTAATSFVINSTSGTETSQVNWLIIN